MKMIHQTSNHRSKQFYYSLNVNAYMIAPADASRCVLPKLFFCFHKVQTTTYIITQNTSRRNAGKGAQRQTRVAVDAVIAIEANKIVLRPLPNPNR